MGNDQPLVGRESGYSNKLVYLFSASALALNVVPSDAWAQEVATQTSAASETSEGLGEIVVTARKREERLQDTPIAVTALAGEDLASRSVIAMADLGGFVPNVSMYAGAGGSGGGANLSTFIRGVGQSEFLFTVDPGVGVYVDGIYYPRSVGSTFDLLDVERVEVLRGPQGTLFGKNTIGGAVSVTSSKPSGRTDGFVELTYGQFNRIDLRGAFEAPLVEDKLAMKVAASTQNRDGYGRRIDFFTGKTVSRPGDIDQAAARLALRFTPSNDVTFDVAADYSRWRQQSVPNQLLSFDQSLSVVPTLWNIFVASPVPMSEAFLAPRRFSSYATGPNRNDLDMWGISGTLAWDVSAAATVKSITAYREMKARFGRDGDGGPVDYIATDNSQKQHQFSQEFQLTGETGDKRLKWVLGAFYFDEFGRDTNDVVLASGFFNAFESLPGPIDGSPITAPTAPGGAGNPINVALDLDFDILNEIRIKSYAAFGQASYALTEALNLTVGARYTHEKKDYTLEHTRIASGVPIIPLTTVGKSWGSFTPMASMDFRLSPQVLAYASFSRGFKSGGFNGRPTVTNTPPVPFNPEKVTAYEFGLKTDLADRKLRLNFATFWNDYTNIQLSRVKANDAGLLVLDLGNAGDAEVKGFEVELQAKPVPALIVSAGLGYTDFKYTKLAPGVTDITLNTKQPFVPKWTGNASIAYTVPLSAQNSLELRTDLVYKSRAYLDPTNVVELRQDGYALVNARITFRNGSNGWDISGFVTNLTDKSYLVGGVSAQSSFGHVEGYFGRPREWGITARKRF